MMAPNFSIITVCRNEAGNIRQTCESVCSQTFSDFEWIIIDGQSSDGTLDVLAEYSSKISCLVSEPDGGIYDAMNKGVQRATGEYLLFLNGGDCLSDEQALEVVSKAPRRDVLYGDMRCVRPSGETFIRSFPDTLTTGFILRHTLPHQAAFFRRSLLEKYGVYNTLFKIAADYDLFVRLLYTHKASYFHIPYVVSDFKTGGASAQSRALGKIENHRVRKKYFPWYIYGVKGLRAALNIRALRRKVVP
jgi:glycosyltransferase involved in cell wall biosynthesis